MEHLHRSDGAEKGSRLPVANEKWSLKEEMTCGAPQGSRVGPLVRNVMYDDFLRMDLPAGTSIIGFGDDTLVMCAADDVKILELRINDSLWWAMR